MNQTYVADAPNAQIAMFLAKNLSHYAIAVGTTVAVGGKLWIACAIAALGCSFTTWLFFGRKAWGSQITMDESAFVFLGPNKPDVRVPFNEVTHVLCKADVATLAWLSNGKKKSIVIGGEHFNTNTWKSFQAALTGLNLGKRN